MTYDRVIGLDLAKRKFHFVELGSDQVKVCHKKIDRENVIHEIMKYPSETTCIAMEACGGANYWAREFKKLGYSVKVMRTIDVKPYIKTQQKNDINDAFAISRACFDINIRSVPIKEKSAQEISHIHKIRKAVIEKRIQYTNELMSCFHEFGYVPNKQSPERFLSEVSDHLEIAHEFAKFSDELYSELKKNVEDLKKLRQREKDLDKMILQTNKQNDLATTLKTIPGVGPLTGSVMSTCVFTHYTDSREFSASLGLVPRQHSTGGVTKLGHITKRGDIYIRKTLVQAARCVLMGRSKGRGEQDPMIEWAYSLWKRTSFNNASVALANKLARICYALAVKGDVYQAQRKTGLQLGVQA